MYEEINNPALMALIVVTGGVAMYLLHTGLKALNKRTSHFDIISPALQSCFDCAQSELYIPPPEKAPNPPAERKLGETTLRCREMLRDETRLTDDYFEQKWGWVSEQPDGDYTAVATKCPRFTLIQGGKK
jgi:hypothetical protein